MSYYTQHFAQQQSPQQKTMRLFFVVALHAALIFVIATAVTKTQTQKPVPVIDLIPIDETTTPPKTVTPLELEGRTLLTTTTWTPPQVETETGKTPPETPPSVIGGQESGTPVSILMRATIIRAPKPAYPSAAARLEEEGTTGMKLLITVEGRVANAQVIQSSGSSRLDDAAIKHVMRNWVFTPCTENGAAVSCEQNMRLKWQLEDAKR